MESFDWVEATTTSGHTYKLYDCTWIAPSFGEIVNKFKTPDDNIEIEKLVEGNKFLDEPKVQWYIEDGCLKESTYSKICLTDKGKWFYYKYKEKMKKYD